MIPTVQQKRALRAQMKAARRALGDAEVARLSAQATARLLALPELAEARGICCYVGVRGELPTLPLIQALLDRGVQVAVPRVDGEQLQAHQLRDLGALVPGAYGIPTSAGPVITPAIDLCITPGLAFTVDGHRLGYGGGYYDRFLLAHPRLRPIGLAYDLQVLPALPTDLHDRPMDAVVTPTRVLRCR